MGVHSDNAQTMSQGGKNKDVCYKRQVSSVTDVLTTFWCPLCIIRVLIYGHMESFCFVHRFDISYPAQNEKCFKNLHSDNSCMQNFGAHFGHLCICTLI